MISFEKIDTYTYLTIGKISMLDTEIKDKLDEISIVGANQFNASVNITLYETVLSRIIGGLFLKNNKECLSGISHVNINITINNTDYAITLGSMNLEDNNGYLNGISRI